MFAYLKEVAFFCFLEDGFEPDDFFYIIAEAITLWYVYWLNCENEIDLKFRRGQKSLREVNLVDGKFDY